jgi:hypothetical protein
MSIPATYQKPPKTLEEQVQILIGRGVVVQNTKKSDHYIRRSRFLSQLKHLLTTCPENYERALGISNFEKVMK